MDCLVAVDGSEEATNALTYAADVAAATDGSLTVAYAVEPAVVDEGGGDPITTFGDAADRLVTESIDDAETRGREVLDEAVEAAADMGHEAEAELLYGEPVGALTAFAEREDSDTVFVGHRGHTERADMLLGSVAKGLVERSPVPVTVVR
ncbi:universal stress protein [Halobacteriales archaeon Cl-PHB]